MVGSHVILLPHNDKISIINSEWGVGSIKNVQERHGMNMKQIKTWHKLKKKYNINMLLDLQQAIFPPPIMLGFHI